MLLDDDYLEKYKPLEIETKGFEEFEIDKDDWQEELHRLERRFNVGCYLLFFIIYWSLLLFFLSLGKALLLIASIGVFYKWLNKRKHKNLIHYHHYTYKFTRKEIIRFSLYDFQTIEYSEIHRLQTSPEGCLLVKKKNWNILAQYLKNNENQKQFFIPNQLQCYPLLVEYLKTKII